MMNQSLLDKATPHFLSKNQWIHMGVVYNEYHLINLIRLGFYLYTHKDDESTKTGLKAFADELNHDFTGQQAPNEVFNLCLRLGFDFFSNPQADQFYKKLSHIFQFQEQFAAPPDVYGEDNIIIAVYEEDNKNMTQYQRVATDNDLPKRNNNEIGVVFLFRQRGGNNADSYELLIPKAWYQSHQEDSQD
jgi:hypothetical protein